MWQAEQVSAAPPEGLEAAGEVDWALADITAAEATLYSLNFDRLRAVRALLYIGLGHGSIVSCDAQRKLRTGLARNVRKHGP